MPEIPANRRGAGPQRPRGDIGRPALRVPDQSRYGPAPGGATPTSGPPRTPRWQLLAWSLDGPVIHDHLVIGEAAMYAELADLERSADFAGAIAIPR